MHFKRYQLRQPIRIPALLLALVLMLSMTACSKEPNPIPLDTAALGVETPYTVVVGQSIIKNLPLPLEGATALMGEVSPGIEVTYTAPDLTIKGLTVGDNTFVITFSAEDYDDAALSLSVTVTEPPPPQLEVALSSELLGVNSGVPLKNPVSFNMVSGIGAQMMVYPAVPGNMTITVESSNPNLNVTAEGNTITLNPTEAGTTTLTIRASQQGFTDAVAECAVEVKPPYVPPDFSGKHLPAQTA